MNLKVLTSTTHIETLIATAMLTTTSGARPSVLFNKLKGDAGRVRRLVDRIETQHGSILEHNRICWLMEASDSEVLELLLSSRFFTITRLGGSRWLLSANLRTIAEHANSRRGLFSDVFLESLKSVAPNISICLVGGMR